LTHPETPFVEANGASRAYLISLLETATVCPELVHLRTEDH